MFYLSFCWQELSPASLVFRQKHVEELISGVGICPEKLGCEASRSVTRVGHVWPFHLVVIIELVEDGRNDADLYRT